jgi:MtN3 and saliva related transmembrane protein
MLLMFIGFIALSTSTISLLPQIYRTYKTKSVEDISLLMLINFLVCSISWIVYGILTDTISVWLTNCIMTIFSIVLLVLKLKYKSQPTLE